MPQPLVMICYPIKVSSIDAATNAVLKIVDVEAFWVLKVSSTPLVTTEGNRRSKHLNYHHNTMAGFPSHDAQKSTHPFVKTSFKTLPACSLIVNVITPSISKVAELSVCYDTSGE